MNQAPLATAMLYVALTAIEHNGEELKYGDPISLTEAQAEPLLGAKAIELAEGSTVVKVSGMSVPVLGEISRLNEILDSVEGRLRECESLKNDLTLEVQDLHAQNQSLAGQLESALTGKASAQSEVAELRVKLNETLDALQASQAAVQEAQAAATSKAGKKG